MVETDEVKGDERLPSVVTGSNVLVAKETASTGPSELPAQPFGRSGSPGTEHEASEQPPWQGEVDPLWRNRDLSCAVLDSHEVVKPMGAGRLIPRTSVVEVRGTGHASG